MSLLFGLYMTLAGLASVSLTLLAVILICRVVRGVSTPEAEAIKPERIDLLKLAVAVSAIQCLTSREAPSPGKLRSESSAWPILSRLEPLRGSEEGGG